MYNMNLNAASVMLAGFLLLMVSCNRNNHREVDEPTFVELKTQYAVIDSSGPFNPWAKFSGDLDQDGYEDIDGDHPLPDPRQACPGDPGRQDQQMAQDQCQQDRKYVREKQNGYNP